MLVQVLESLEFAHEGKLTKSNMNIKTTLLNPDSELYLWPSPSRCILLDINPSPLLGERVRINKA